MAWICQPLQPVLRHSICVTIVKKPCDEEIDAEDEEETCFYAAAVEYRALVGDPRTPAPATWHPDATERKQRKHLCTTTHPFFKVICIF